MSVAVRPRPNPWAEPLPHPRTAASELEAARPLRPVDERLLTLLGAHEVLTSGQLVRLTGVPERTVQHRLGLLYRAGLLNRLRPERPVGTSPYHCWLTSFGAAAIGAEASEHLGDPNGVQATALLSELWLAVRDRGEATGLRLIRWQRLPSGVPFHDHRTRSPRELPAEAELTVAVDPFCGTEMTSLVISRVERIPKARLEAVLARFASYLAGSAEGHRPVVLTILVRTPRVAEVVLAVVEQLGSAKATRNLTQAALITAERRVVVGTVEPRPIGLVTEAVWRTTDRRTRRLVEILTEVAKNAK